MPATGISRDVLALASGGRRLYMWQTRRAGNRFTVRSLNHAWKRHSCAADPKADRWKREDTEISAAMIRSARVATPTFDSSRGTSAFARIAFKSTCVPAPFVRFAAVADSPRSTGKRTERRGWGSARKADASGTEAWL